MELLLETPIDNQLAGYRLGRLELLNWGTFDRQVWTIVPSGRNALLTGDIGSGKSTIVDAVTTLLVPHQRITYNKAAGADSRERSLYSYLKGAYKNEKVEQSSKAKDVYVRADNNFYSVLLAVFQNEGYGQAVTLAQVFWLRNNQPQKFYVLATGELGIIDDFSNFGADVLRLKKRLRGEDKVEVFDTFTDYSNRFRQVFGIQQPEALDLFYQTVSMKSVGNLTDFVREQMLGRTDVQQKIDELVHRYQELTQAYESVQRARRQRDILAPLMVHLNEHAGLQANIQDLERAQAELPAWFATRRLDILRRELSELRTALERNTGDLDRQAAELEQQRGDEAQLRATEAGLDVARRLEQLRFERRNLEQELERRRAAAGRYDQLAATLDLPGHPDRDRFLANRAAAESGQREAAQHLDEISRRRPPLHVEEEQHRAAAEALGEEIESLRRRGTQIPRQNLDLRERLLRDLDLTAADLPFAGELLRVREEAADWEGAIERRLRGLGLSLLVPDRHYRRVSDYVDHHHLGGKLVYLRTIERERPRLAEPDDHSLVRKVQIKEDTEFYDWLEAELLERHDLACCETMEEFRRAYFAVTRAGQIKAGKISHSKDDRFDVNDRKRYILGWTNQQKIAALEKARSEHEQTLQTVRRQLAGLRAEDRQWTTRRETQLQLLQFEDFNQIDFDQTAAQIQQRLEEEQRLENNSEELLAIREELRRLRERLRRAETAYNRLNQERGALNGRLQQTADALLEALTELQMPLPETADVDPTDFIALSARFSDLDLTTPSFSEGVLALTADLVYDVKTKVTIVNRDEKQLLQRIGGELKDRRDAKGRLENRIVAVMKDFGNEFPEETLEVDASVEAMPEYRSIHDRLVADDIPRHESRFRSMLKERTINSILIFKNQLEAYDKEISDKIERINTHLREIDYNEGAYIRIVSEVVRTADIIEFQRDLRACLENIYGETDHYNEEKFFQVKKLLDRFRGETEEDSRWTRRVTDVRQWYTFGAQELYREDDSEKEYYSDSAGKSGGQKEKLAYTILASAIAFQFGLEWGATRSRSFRFVVIDEAFGRGSDDSTRYGLELFQRLNLQLLIVTPLQKINIIEDYVDAVHYVSNPDGRNSLVRNITKAEYLAEKAAFYADRQGADL